MAAPIYGYAAYSQLYASLIERVAFLCSKQKPAADILKDEEIRRLTERMAYVVKEMTKSEIDIVYIQSDIMAIVPGLAAIAAGVTGKEDAAALIEKFILTYSKQHRWNLPYAKAVDWNQVHEYFQAQKRALEAA
jgi:hypothetical protein